MLGASAGPLYEGNLARNERTIPRYEPPQRVHRPAKGRARPAVSRPAAQSVPRARVGVTRRSLAILAGVFLGALLVAYLQLQSISLGYRLMALQSELQAVQQQNQNLALEVARLGSLSRIQAEATRLGMVQPAEVRVAVMGAGVSVSDAASPPGVSELPTQGLAYAASRTATTDAGSWHESLRRLWARLLSLWHPGSP